MKRVFSFLGTALSVTLAAVVALTLSASLANAVECGVASWYGHTGNPTASGEPHPTPALTAAHRSAPFGTLFLVTRLDTKEAVVVRVNDRGPYVRGRVIDLSPKAAAALNMKHVGVATVCIDKIPRKRLRTA